MRSSCSFVYTAGWDSRDFERRNRSRFRSAMTYLSEHHLLIQDALTRILEDLCQKQTVDAAENGEFPSALWEALSETGLTLTGLPEEYGGSGGDLSDALIVMKGAGKFSAPIPIAENFLGRVLCCEFGLSAPKGIATFCDNFFSITPDGQLRGSSSQTAFGPSGNCFRLFQTVLDRCRFRLFRIVFGPFRNVFGSFWTFFGPFGSIADRFRMSKIL